MNRDLLKYTYKGLMQRAKRTTLTILSILIGIMAIFALVSFGQGLSKYVDDIAQEMGTNKIIIQQKSIGAVPDGGITADEVDVISKVKGVSIVTGMSLSTTQIQPDDKTPVKYAYLMGLPTEREKMKVIEEMMTVKILEGRNIKKGDNLKAVLGYSYSQPEKIFTKPFVIGQKILVNGVSVDIIGFYEEIGNPQDDSNIYLTYEGYERITGEKDNYGMVVATTEEGVSPTELAEKITIKLRKYKGEEEGKETFTVQTFEALIEQFSNILGVLNTVLVLIALISVVISAINITNTMYTSVLERTKDIGIMKAIGAKNRDIMLIFLIESGILGLIGGILGVGLGYLISSAGGSIAAAAGYSSLQPYFSPYLIIACLVFATVIGAGAGLTPAIQASKQKPVDSLRYE